MMFLQIMIVATVTSQIFVCGGEVDSKILANGEVYDPQVGIGVVIINFTITDISVIIINFAIIDISVIIKIFTITDISVIIHFTITDISVIINIFTMFTRTTVGPQSPT